MSFAPLRKTLPGGREHWQHGPIDLVIEARGDAAAVARACEKAWVRFQAVLAELVFELPLLRLSVEQSGAVRGPVARRMIDAALPYVPRFITPMAAVAGAVAEEILAIFAAEPGVARAYVNNGGDIALHLLAGEEFTIGLVADAYAPAVDGQVRISAESGIRGIATSGWRGRSFSLGIADSVTVLARSASAADAAATMIANAVNAEHPAIERTPAETLKDDTDLGARLVTVNVGKLPATLRAAALDAGAKAANQFLGRGLIIGAALALQNEWRSVGDLQAALPAGAQRLAA
ncbi:MAG TPA: UPF0280 family protein [Burkholderiales bacterium]|nr:UPF0280 family protein [Burkholderiales bacterium]